jgi:hypothetical protein
MNTSSGAARHLPLEGKAFFPPILKFIRLWILGQFSTLPFREGLGVGKIGISMLQSSSEE